MNYIINKIIKRDGKKENFNSQKITNAIIKAIQQNEFTSKEAYKLTSEIEKYLEENNIFKIEKQEKLIEIEKIQDVVETILIKNNYPLTAKAFILYRKERNKIREMKSNSMKTMKDITFSDSKYSEIKRENANIDGNSTMGTMLKYGSEIAKDFNKKFLIKQEHVDLHEKGIIHIHDLDFYALTINCLQIPADKLLKNGFNTGHGFIRTPSNINSASSLIAIILQSNQNEMFGGQSIPALDFYLAPYVAKSYIKNLCNYIDIQIDDTNISTQIKINLQNYLKQHIHIINKTGKNFINNLLDKYISKQNYPTFNKEKALSYTIQKTDKDTYQAMEALIHNLCTMQTRSGSQVPFSSLNLGIDITEEGRMITKNLFLATEAGLGHGETPIFPISIFSLKKGINREKTDPNYDLFRLACRCSAKRLFPNFNNLDSTFNAPYYKENQPETICAVMGCRTRVLGNDYKPKNAITPGRGNLSFTTLNLPYLALLAKQNNPQNTEEEFYILLEKYSSIIFEQLLDRFEIQAKRKVKNFPFLFGENLYIDSQNLNSEDEIRNAIKNGTLSIGFIGLAECLKVLYKKHHGELDPIINQKGLNIIKKLYELCNKQTKKTNLNFSLIASPAEGCSGRLLKLTSKKFGKIKNVTDREYFTNSFHVPVYQNIKAWDKIQIESQYHKYCLAGAISYIEIASDLSNNIDAFEKIITTMADSNMGYFSINHPVDYDPICGYVGIIGDTCPKCGRKSGEAIHITKIK